MRGEGLPHKGVVVEGWEVTDRRSGEIPDDLSLKASNERLARTRTWCASAGTLDQWTVFGIATLDEMCSRLATVEGRDSEFARSLADQFVKKGSLSVKQERWVNSLYREYSQRHNFLCLEKKRHDWNEVGSILHRWNIVLDTYSATSYKKCSKCGEWSETRSGNNYSGD